ncbi:MAG TPA: AzlD domain-containing protein [Steroidobacteraceae bacterium]|jgi:branched-subunit amino acid transport protein|nr:AzlD domain-containing protein [Steroidobacteraceae bacterium]
MNPPVEGIALAVVIVGLALSTFVTRTSFLLAGGRARLNHRIEVALRYAPVCTLTAIVVPDVLMHGREYADFSLLNPRLVGVLVSGIWLCFSRNILGCLAFGMVAFSLARLYL